MIVAALTSGARALYIEKPFTRTCAEADEVIALARSRGATLTVAHRNRPHPALPVLKRYLDEGSLGNLLEVRARGKEDQRGGAQDLWVLGGHLFDTATLFTGPAIACTAGVYQGGRPATRADVHDGAEGVGPIVGDEIHARFDTSSGVPIFYDSKKGAGSVAAGFGLQIVCARGLVDLRMDIDPLVHVQQGSPFEPTTAPRRWVPLTSAGLGTPEPVAGLTKRLLGHVAGVEDLLDAMRDGREPLCGPVAALRTIEMTQGIFASFVAGTRVTLPLAQRTTPLGE
jgi:predicted dehydrogenase